MICYFSVKNFKNFNDEFVFDLSDVNDFEFNTECIKNDVVNKAVIYGYNSTGKSNLGFAMFDIIIHITDKYRNQRFYENYFNALSKSEIAEFCYKFKFNKDILEYRYGKTSPTELVYETLLISGKKIIDYDKRRDSMAIINILGAETLNKDLGKINISLLKYVKANAVLDKGRESSLLQEFYAFIDNMLFFKSLDERSFQGYETQHGTEIMNDIITRNHFDDFKNFLKTAGIDTEIKVLDANGEKKFFFDFGLKIIDFWSAASTGTRTLVLFYFWLQRIRFEARKPSFLFIDEFDAFYHQVLSLFLVNELKKNDCQVVLTTHNPAIMSNDVLRPDCYFLMFKDGARSLSRCTPKELRKAHNIEKMYRAGSFDE